ncbi:Arm DNA-binding domain-containing protein [Novosphingobium sp.]|nr:Arm DNA-binding domain-containing protein [Novosphingobium sp.]
MLSDTRIKKAAPGERDYKLADERGLHLLVRPSGGKLWRLKYRIAGKE